MRRALTSLAAAAALFAFTPAVAAAQVSAGDVVVADPNAFGGQGGLIDVNPDTGAQSPLSNNAISTQKLFRDPTGVAFDPESGSLVVADPNAFGGTGGLIRVDPVSGQQSTISAHDTPNQAFFQDPIAVARAADGTLYVADPGSLGGSGAVIAVDPATGVQSPIATKTPSSPPYWHPHGITVEPGGTLLVADADAVPGVDADSGGAIVAVDPKTGSQKVISSNSSSKTDLFGNPLGVAVETPGTLLVANRSQSPASTGVILVNRSSGQQYALSTDASFVAPTAITMNLDGQALVADSAAFGGSGGVIRVDPVSGQRTLLSGDPNAPTALFADPSGILVVPPTCLGRYATIVGTEGADAITGTPGADVISARGGDDIVDGGGGSDLICGDDGRDRLIGRDGKDRFLGAGGGDVILGGNGADIAKGGTGNDKIDGGRGADRLYGQQKRDTLAGGKGNDLLNGGPGRDKLSGGAGHDKLRGGPGKDLQKQ